MTWPGAANAVLMTVKATDGPPTLAEAARQLGLEIDALDPEFAVVLISPDRGLYSVRVDASRLGGTFDPQHGPYSDPPIAPMKAR